MKEKRLVTLTLTNACNLKCIYCYEENKSKDKISFETAKSIIDKEFALDDETPIEFDLFGGEPFLAFDLIKKIDAYLVENYYKRKWILFATTNGTLVHGEIQEWLKKRPYFVCGLSLDGNKYMQDINRSNSFDQIDLEFFTKQYPQQGLKMTISEKTLPYLYEGTLFLHSLNVPFSNNLAHGIDWSNKENVDILSRELSKLIDYYIEHPEIEPARILNYSIEQVGLSNGEIPNSVHCWCGAGDMHTYDVNGDMYPCQFFMPLSVGEEKAKKSKEINFVKEVPITLLDEKCQKCPIVVSCPTCYGSNYCSSGNIYAKEDNFCKLTKITFKAISYLKALQWERGQLSLDSSKELLLLRAIKVIQDMSID